MFNVYKNVRLTNKINGLHKLVAHSKGVCNYTNLKLRLTLRNDKPFKKFGYCWYLIQMHFHRPVTINGNYQKADKWQDK